MKKKVFREKYYGTSTIKEEKEVKIDKPKRTRKVKGDK